MADGSTADGLDTPLDGSTRDASEADGGDDNDIDSGALVDSDAGSDGEVDGGTDIEGGMDGGAGIDGGVSVDSGMDGGPGLDSGTPPLCSVTFGTVLAFELCEQTGTTCRFYANTLGTNCAAICQANGTSCLAAEHEDPAGGNCATLSNSSCTFNDSDDTICICTR